MPKLDWQDWINVLLGGWLFVSSWLLQQTVGHQMVSSGSGTLATWNVAIIGFAVTGLAIFALVTFAVWEEWVNVALGTWLLLSPWLVGFSTSHALMWNAMIVGLLVAVFACWKIEDEEGIPSARD